MKRDDTKSSTPTNTTAFPIESGVPVPKVRLGAPSPYPWELLIKVGDSFFVPNGKLGSLRMGCYNRSQPGGPKLRAYAVEGGVRVWRMG